MKNLFKYKSKCCNEPIARCQDWYYCTNCLDFVKGITFYYPIIIGIMIVIILSLCSFTVKAPNNKLKNPINIEQYAILNDSSITNKLLELGCILPNVALAQIKQETGNYTSSLTFTHKNLGGIRVGKRYKKYNNYIDCLKDCIKIQDMYLAQLHKKYAEDTTYIYKLKFIK